MNSRAQRPIATTLALVVSFLVGTECAAAWKAEQGVETPSYAVTEPASTNLNIDSVVLMCEAVHDSSALQLQIYLSDDGPLRPDGVPATRLKAEPRAEIQIDDQVFPVSMLFADDYVVLADSQLGPFPLLSDRLLDAMEDGKRMLLRFDMVGERPGQAPAYDGEAVVELATAAISAVRKCAQTPDARGVAALAGR